MWMTPFARSCEVGIRRLAHPHHHVGTGHGGPRIGDDGGAGRAVFVVGNPSTGAQARFDGDREAEADQLLDAGRNQRRAQFTRPRFFRHADAHAVIPLRG